MRPRQSLSWKKEKRGEGEKLRAYALTSLTLGEEKEERGGERASPRLQVVVPRRRGKRGKGRGRRGRQVPSTILAYVVAGL